MELGVVLLKQSFCNTVDSLGSLLLAGSLGCDEKVADFAHK